MSFSEYAGHLVDALRSALTTVEERVVHTLTSMGCPLRPVIERDVADALAVVDGVESVDVQLVFEPPWSPDRMSDDARFLLGVYG